MTSVFQSGLLLFMLFGPYIILMVWLYKSINVKLNNLRKMLYAITMILASYSLYMVLYYKFGDFLKGFDTDIIQKLGDDLVVSAHGLSFFVFPLSALFIVISVVVFIIHFIIKVVRKK